MSLYQSWIKINKFLSNRNLLYGKYPPHVAEAWIKTTIYKVWQIVERLKSADTQSHQNWSQFWKLLNVLFRENVSEHFR